MAGLPDPRYPVGGSAIDPRLARQLRGYARLDDPPRRVKPIPVPILHAAYAIAAAAGDDESLATADMMWLAFFFLLRPGEYTKPTEDTHPFRIQDVRLHVCGGAMDYRTATSTQLDAIDFVGLEFTTQKNGVRGEVVGHGLSGHPTACPVKLVIRRLAYLRSIGAPNDTFLCAYRKGGSAALTLLAARTLTKLLRQATLTLGASMGLAASEICAKSLRASGAMALLNRQVDRDTIQLVGRWKSDAMLCYLHIQAHGIMARYSSIMLLGGEYALIPTDAESPLPVLETP